MDCKEGQFQSTSREYIPAIAECMPSVIPSKNAVSTNIKHSRYFH